MWFMQGEVEMKRDKSGTLLRKDQVEKPELEIGDRFFDLANGRWAILLRIKPPELALGAPFEALYDGCDRFEPFIGTAMYADIGEIERCK